MTLLEMLRITYPNHDFLPWKFRSLPRLYWKNEHNLKPVVLLLEQRFDLKTPDDWYKLNTSMFETLERTIIVSAKMACANAYHSSAIVNRVLNSFKGSPYEFVRTAFPNHTWLPWKFSRAPHHFWAKSSNVRMYFDWLKEELGFKTLEDLYALKHSQVGM